MVHGQFFAGPIRHFLIRQMRKCHPNLQSTLSFSLSLSLSLSLSAHGRSIFCCVLPTISRQVKRNHEWLESCLKIEPIWRSIIPSALTVNSWSHEEENEDKNDVTADASSLKLIFLFRIDLIEPHRFDYITLVLSVRAEMCFVISRWEGYKVLSVDTWLLAS